VELAISGKCTLFVPSERTLPNVETVRIQGIQGGLECIRFAVIPCGEPGRSFRIDFNSLAMVKHFDAPAITDFDPDIISIHE
jgi:hypothetical protein